MRDFLLPADLEQQESKLDARFIRIACTCMHIRATCDLCWLGLYCRKKLAAAAWRPSYKSRGDIRIMLLGSPFESPGEQVTTIVSTARTSSSFAEKVKNNSCLWMLVRTHKKCTSFSTLLLNFFFFFATWEKIMWRMGFDWRSDSKISLFQWIFDFESSL